MNLTTAVKKVPFDPEWFGLHEINRTLDVDRCPFCRGFYAANACCITLQIYANTFTSNRDNYSDIATTITRELVSCTRCKSR